MSAAHDTPEASVPLGDFIWQDPPATRQRSRGKRRGAPPAEHFPRLRAHPGRWARLRIYLSARTATSAKWHLKRRADEEGVELIAVGHDLYGRFVGTEGSQDE